MDGAHGIVNFVVRVTARTGLSYITQIEGVAAYVAWTANEFIGWVIVVFYQDVGNVFDGLEGKGW